MPALSEVSKPLPHIQRDLSSRPWSGVQDDFDRIYNQGKIEIGAPSDKTLSVNARPNTVGIAGGMYGDEGKGRLVDNKISALLEEPGVTGVNVIRFNGGNNAGHTLETDQGIRMALHVIPSAILYPETRGIIDRGAVVHPDNLQIEVAYAEEYAGSLRGQLFLSEEAILCTDLERAEEGLNRIRSGGAATGGTGRGIGPSYAHHYDRLGTKVMDLLDKGWKGSFADRYERYQQEFAAFGRDLKDELVPDFEKEKMKGLHEPRTVGTKAEYLDRLEAARDWIIDRGMTLNTFALHSEIYSDPSQAVLFEGAQGISLHPWLGSYPDVTTSDTSMHGIISGTGFWKPEDVRQKIGIVKGPYTSSVGRRHLLTEIPLSRENNDLPDNATHVQERGVFIRAKARETGTTTGRWRDVAELDLANLSYNATMGGIDVLAVTMMDIAREGDIIRVSTHYTREGQNASYQPGLRYIEGFKPQYVELPGWDGEACRNAGNLADFPENALKYLSFMQARTGFPVVAATAGPERNKLFTAQGYKLT